MQFNVASALGSLALTASIYGAGPLLLRLRKGPISSKALKWLHIGYTAVLAFAFSIYDFSNGYDISFSPAILWGSIFYWWNRSYFETRNYPPVQPATPVQAAPASPDPVLSGTELPAVIPEKKVKKAAPRALMIGLVVALALSLAGNVWQSLAWNAEKKEFDSESRGREFKSRHSDQEKPRNRCGFEVFSYLDYSGKFSIMPNISILLPPPLPSHKRPLPIAGRGLFG